MGTCAILAVLHADRTLVLRTSHDGFVDNVFASIAPAIVAGGLNTLKRNFSCATFIDEEDEEDLNERTLMRDNASAYILACEENNRPVFDLEAMMNYPHGIADFAHHGGGLLFGACHIHLNGWITDPRTEADFVLDLDANTLSAKDDGAWTINLTDLADKDPQAIADFLNSFNFHINEELASDKDFNPSLLLNKELRALPDFSPDTVLSGNEAPAAASVSTNVDVSGDTMIYRFHPNNFIFVRLLTQVFQRAALDTNNPNWEAVVAGLQVERSDEQCGVVLTCVPKGLENVLTQVGELLTSNYGTQVVNLGASGGISVRHAGGGFASTAGFGGMGGIFGDDDNDERPDPATLSAPFTFEERIQRRQNDIDLLRINSNPQSQQLLASELFIALLSFDPQSFEQLTAPDVRPLLGSLDIQDLPEGEAELAATWAQVESLVNPEGLRARYNALPEEARTIISAPLSPLARRQLNNAVGQSQKRFKLS